MDQLLSPLVLEFGSLNSRVGLAAGCSSCNVSPKPEETSTRSFNTLEPEEVILSLVGVPKSSQGMMMNHVHKSVYFGSDANRHRAICRLAWPIDGGNVMDWDRLTQLIDYSYIIADIADPTQHDVVILDPVTSSREQRARLASIMLERFRAPGIYFAPCGVMGLFSTGRTSGLVFESGETHSVSIGVIDGIGLPHATRRNEICGSNVTHYLTSMINTHIVSSARDSIRDMKEKFAYVSLDFMSETRKCAANPSAFTQIYHLPDGQFVELSTQCFSCTEPVFNPVMQYGMNHHYEGYPTTILNTLGIAPSGTSHGTSNFSHRSTLPSEFRDLLCKNIVLCGGNTLLRGFKERMQLELNLQSPTECHVDGQGPQKRGCVRNWRGAAIVAQLSTFSNIVKRKSDCDESGYDIVCMDAFYNHR